MIAASIAMFVLARVMPQRTMSGAMVYAWLAAYRRTLERTLAGARSMDEVVASHALPWVETPDQAVVWGYALGLHHEVEDVLERTIETGREAAASGQRPPYLPAWYVVGSPSSSAGWGERHVLQLGDPRFRRHDRRVVDHRRIRVLVLRRQLRGQLWRRRLGWWRWWRRRRLLAGSARGASAEVVLDGELGGTLRAGIPVRVEAGGALDLPVSAKPADVDTGTPGAHEVVERT